MKKYSPACHFANFQILKNRCEMAVVCEMAVDPSGKLRNGSGSGICEMAGDREFKPQFIEGVSKILVFGMSLNIISSTFSIHKKKSNLFFLNKSIFSTTMFLQKRKRESYTNLEQKLWLVKHREENKKISLARIAMDFSAEFNRPISISGISRIISQKDELLALSNADPEIETKRVKKMVSLDRAQFESDLQKLLVKIYNREEF